MKIKTILTVAAGLAASVSAQAALTYDFNDGMQGWQNITVSSAPYLELSFMSTDDGGIAGSGAYLGETPATKSTAVNWWSGDIVYPNPGSGIHQTVRVQSPAFTLDGSGPLTFNAAGTENYRNVSLVGLTIPEVAGTWGDSESPAFPESTRGCALVGLRDATTDQFVLSTGVQHWGNWYNGAELMVYGFSAEQLASVAVPGHTYTLDLVDFLGGQGSPWIQVDNVSIPGALAVPEPSTFALLGLGGLALLFRRRK